MLGHHNFYMNVHIYMYVFEYLCTCTFALKGLIQFVSLHRYHKVLYILSTAHTYVLEIWNTWITYTCNYLDIIAI